MKNSKFQIHIKNSERQISTIDFEPDSFHQLTFLGNKINDILLDFFYSEPMTEDQQSLIEVCCTVMGSELGSDVLDNRFSDHLCIGLNTIFKIIPIE